MTDIAKAIGSRIAILGAGSIGCYLGGRLIEGRADVVLIGRDRYRDAIADNGLSLSHYERAPVTPRDVDFRTELSALQDAETIGLCVKSQDTEEAATQIARYAPTARVVSFQNGVSNLSVLRRILPNARISGAVVPFNVTSPVLGRFHRGTAGDLIIGPNAPEALVSPLQNAKVGVRTVDDIEGYLWAKLLVNLNNALNALSGGPLREGLLQRDYRRVLIAMIREGLTVAKAEGVTVTTFNGRHPEDLLRVMARPDWLYRLIMDRIVKIDRTARSSMLDDLEAGRASELDYLQGEIVRRAERLDIDVPVNRAVMAATRKAFAQRRTPCLSGAQMQQAFLT